MNNVNENLMKRNEELAGMNGALGFIVENLIAYIRGFDTDHADRMEKLYQEVVNEKANRFESRTESTKISVQ